MTDMDKQVLAFLKEWLAWAEAGGPEHETFKRWNGLCANADRYSSDELGNYFEGVIFADALHPFGPLEYRDRAISQTQHECPKRLAWVRNKIEELENMG